MNSKYILILLILCKSAYGQSNLDQCQWNDASMKFICVNNDNALVDKTEKLIKPDVNKPLSLDHFQPKLRDEEIKNTNREPSQTHLKRLKNNTPEETSNEIRTSPPSLSYSARIRSLISSKIVISQSTMDDIRSGNVSKSSETEVEASCNPEGEIISRKIIKSSGNQSYDVAVLNALDAVGKIPKDTNGWVPPKIVFTFKLN
jgi:colicin import membrane protein